jgi:hypothetical protein
MVELWRNNCKRVFQYSVDEKIYTICPRCNPRVPIARPRITVQTTQKYSKVKENPRLSKAIF